ncbi:hypothetical protein HK097_001551 [Rhizophlyctis rosea]|uniref:Nascent polypeptide-associated complex subunit alpha-like UBA domain-containing protein n=1 Tax=Rhizophlyctis rosea TaxID=64517 RepID=A0AAD5WYA2_9FUNG|nr:hypothetical protein HK097_001551 [Rhizophlyctis rosea]
MPKKKSSFAKPVVPQPTTTTTAVAPSPSHTPAPKTTPPTASDTTPSSTTAIPPPTPAPETTTPTTAEQDDAEPETGLKGQANKDMQAVTGYFEEKNSVDENKIGKAMTFLTDVNKKAKPQKSARDTELAKVVISKEDVELVMTQLEITKIQAERALRENKGDAVETLRQLIAV